VIVLFVFGAGLIICRFVSSAVKKGPVKIDCGIAESFKEVVICAIGVFTGSFKKSFKA